jgi:hypothetical protein
VNNLLQDFIIALTGAVAVAADVSLGARHRPKNATFVAPGWLALRVH